MRTSWIACDLWYDVSCGNYLEYWECPGNMMLNWKDKGYRTVFELLQVSLNLLALNANVQPMNLSLWFFQ